MRIRRSSTAMAITLALGISGLALSISPTSAAYEEERPGAQSPSMAGDSSWKLSAPDALHAQPFTQPEDGRLARVRIEAYEAYNQVSHVALHSFTPGVGPSAEPIEGGTNVEITYEPSSNTPQGSNAVWVVVNFVDRPALEAGETYALVIDPAHPVSGETASFVIRLFPLTADASWVFSATDQGGTGWSAYATAHMIFSTDLVTIFGEPIAPELQPAQRCGVEPVVALPEAEGVRYEQTRDDNTITVTATPADGYALPTDATTEWTFNVAAEACQDSGTGAEDEVPSSHDNDLADSGVSMAAGMGFALALLAAGSLLLSIRSRTTRATGRV